MQIQKSDESAMEVDTSTTTALYDRYAHIIFAYLRLHLSSLEDAEDVTLEVFVAALEHYNLAGLSAQEQLMWLRRVASNKKVDIYRQKLFQHRHQHPDRIQHQHQRPNHSQHRHLNCTSLFPAPLILGVPYQVYHGFFQHFRKEA